jgi:hypothetical protein
MKLGATDAAEPAEMLQFLARDPGKPHSADSTTRHVDGYERHRQLAPSACLLGGDIDERCRVLGPGCPLLPPEQTDLFQQLGPIAK